MLIDKIKLSFLPLFPTHTPTLYRTIIVVRMCVTVSRHLWRINPSMSDSYSQLTKRTRNSGKSAYSSIGECLLMTYISQLPPEENAKYSNDSARGFAFDLIYKVKICNCRC